MFRLTLPDVRQAGEADCGLAVLNTVLAFHRRPAVRAIAPGIPCEMDGTDPRTLESLFRGHGLRVQAGDGWEFGDLDHHVRQNRPVVCLVQENGTGHYVLCRGLDSDGWDVRVYYQCPLFGPHSTTGRDFRRRWHDRDRLGVRFDRWAMAIGV